MDDIISLEQSAFIKSRQILDGLLCVNEIISIFKKKKKNLMLFKIDFAKAFDSVSWSFLDRLLEFMNFGLVWRKWIRTCLSSAQSSVLLNGSPSQEFQLLRGIRLGDLLSPFLFIIVMEGLHVALEDATRADLFTPVCIRDIRVSHFFFTDDVLLLGKWDRANVLNVVHILNSFHKASGLSINLSKSKISGVGISNEDLLDMATVVKCQPQKLLFTYLGIPIDMNMSLCANWDSIRDKFNKRLTAWKRNSLSIGGRSTLVSSVLGALGSYFFSLFPMPIKVNTDLEAIRSRFFWGHALEEKHCTWIAWNKVLADKSKGGLGIGSLYALNRAFILKWRWRYINCPNALWVRIINNIHGVTYQGSEFFSKCYTSGVWSKIVGTINSLHEKGIVSKAMIKREIKDGKTTKFWLDAWCTDSPLKNIYPRLFILDSRQQDSLADKWSQGWHFHWLRSIDRGITKTQLDDLLNTLPIFVPSNQQDKWVWNNGNTNVFTVKDARVRIDATHLPAAQEATRWYRFLPKKINILLWRVFLDRIPTRWNMRVKGIDIPQLLCPICCLCPENSFHILWSCPVAKDVWRKISSWLGVDLPNILCTQDIFEWATLKSIFGIKKQILEAIIGITIWSLWSLRNDVIFRSPSPSRSCIFDKIVSYSFLWFSNRNRKASKSWNAWMFNPLLDSYL